MKPDEELDAQRLVELTEYLRKELENVDELLTFNERLQETRDEIIADLSKRDPADVQEQLEKLFNRGTQALKGNERLLKTKMELSVTLVSVQQQKLTTVLLGRLTGAALFLRGASFV